MDIHPIIRQDVARVYGHTQADLVTARLIAEAPAMMELIGDIGRWFDIALSLGQISRGTANRDSDLVTQIRAILSRIEEGRS